MFLCMCVSVGIVVGMTVPPVYVKYEDKIKGFGERLRMQFKRYYDMVDEKVLSKIRNGVVGERKTEVKAKKIE